MKRNLRRQNSAYELSGEYHFSPLYDALLAFDPTKVFLKQLTLFAAELCINVVIDIIYY